MKYTDKNKPPVCMQTNSRNYKGTSTMTIKGVLWHCTGANNPTLKRYVQPKDSSSSKEHKDNTYTNAEWITLLGKNTNGNDWNHVNDREVGLNAWVGKLADGSVTAVQTMPWNYKPWGCGGGCNNGWIQFEICEDDLTDQNYFNAAYIEACELTAYLCKMYNINPKGSVTYNGKTVPTILCHYDSYKLGLGSSHYDVYNWFNKFNKTMQNVRDDVNLLLNSANFELTPENATTGGTSGGNTNISTPSEPVVPTIPTLIKSISVKSASYDSVTLTLKTSEHYSVYNWHYNLTNLNTGKVKNKKELSVKAKKTNFMINELSPNSDYLITIVALDKDKNEIILPDFIFSTKANAPKSIKNLTFTLDDTDLSKAKCTISFSPPSSWGSYDDNTKSKGYSIALYSNGIQKGKSDTLIAFGTAKKTMAFAELLSKLNVKNVTYNDIVQISVTPWILDTDGTYIYAEDLARSTEPMFLARASNIKNINNFFLKTSDSFKRITIFNFCK